MCVNNENTRVEDVELVETLASTMTDSPELGNLLIAIVAMIKQGGTMCLAMAPEATAEAQPEQRPPGIYPPEPPTPGNYL